MKHLQHTSKTSETFEIHACNMLLLAAALCAASSGMSTRTAAFGWPDRGRRNNHGGARAVRRVGQ
jgi:hypothetical protein